MMLSSQKEIEMKKGDPNPPTEPLPIPHPNSSKKYFDDKEQSNMKISEPLLAPPPLLSITSELHSTLEKHVQQKVDTSLKTKSLRWLESKTNTVSTHSHNVRTEVSSKVLLHNEKRKLEAYQQDNALGSIDVSSKMTSAAMNRLATLKSAVDMELHDLKIKYGNKFEALESVNGMHDLQLRILDRSILTVSRSIQALNSAVNNDNTMLEKRNDELQADIKFMQVKLHEAEEWLSSMLEDKESKMLKQCLSISSIVENIEKLRDDRSKLLKTSNVLSTKQSKDVRSLQKELENILGVKLDDMTTRMAQRSHFFDQSISDLKIGFTKTLDETQNDEYLLQTLIKDFKQLKMAIKIQDENHKEVLHRVNSEIVEQRKLLRFRKKQTEKEIENAKRKMKQQIYEDIEVEWKIRLDQAKEEGQRRIREEEDKCRKKYDAVYEVLTKRYADEYNHVIHKLELKKQHHLKRQKTAAAEHRLLQDREKRAKESLDMLRKKAEDRRNADAVQMNLYNAARKRVENLWDRYDVPVHERISFLLRVDELLPYSDEAADLYKNEINRYQDKRRNTTCGGNCRDAEV